MNSSFKEIIYLIIACLFGIFAILFYKAKNIKSFWLSLQSTLACIMTLNYNFLITVTEPNIKVFLFKVHLTLIVIISFSIYDFILILSDVKNITRARIFLFLAMSFLLIMCYIFPVHNVIDVNVLINWKTTLNYFFKIPSVIIFILQIIIISFLSTQRLFYYYKNFQNYKRKRIACYFLGIAFLIMSFINILDFSLRYFLNFSSFYYDLSVFTVFIFLSTVLICQKYLYILEIETNNLIYKIIDKIPESFAVFDYKLRLIWCNKNFEKIFLHNKSLPENPHIKNFILPDADEKIFKTKAKIKTNILVDKKTYKVLFTSLPFYSKYNDFIFGVYYIQDMTSFEMRKEKIYKRKKFLQAKIENKTQALKNLNLRLKNLISEKIEQEEKNFNILNYDMLTGLYNRKTIIQKLNALISARNELSVICIDIDDVKMLNDSFGHNVVDKLIIKLVKRLNSIQYKKTVSRFGGDEFLIILDENENVSKACIDIQKSLRKPFTVDANRIKITVSIGISIFPNDAIDATSLIRFADMAMYESKERGKNSISYFHAKLKTKIESEFFISEQIKADLLNGRIIIMVEPIIKANKNGVHKMCAIEATSNWTYKIENSLHLDSFTEILRRANILKKYDRWLVTTAIKKVSENILFKENDDLTLMVPVSDLTFYNPIFFDYMVEILGYYKISSSKIEIEITESTLMLKPQIAIKNINQLQQFGIKVTIKNFGVSYSSLNYMKNLNFDKIKISKIFVSEIGKNKKDEGIIRLLILLAERINLKISAEGVNTLKQFEFLQQNNCNVFQGSFFSNPLQLEEFLKSLEESKIEKSQERESNP